MSTVLAFGSRHVLLPLVLWTFAALLLALAASLPMISWSNGRLRRQAEVGARPTRARVWTCKGWVLLLHVVILPIVAVVTAVPFSLERSFASLFETTAPSAVTWAVDLGSNAASKAMGITTSATVADLGAIQQQLMPHVQALNSRIARGGLLRRIPLQLEALYLDELADASRRLLEANPRVTWGDILDSTKSQVQSRASQLFRHMATTLRVAAFHHALLLAIMFLGANLASVVFVFVLARAAPTIA